MTLENEERRARGPRVDQKFYDNELEKKLVSRLFLYLGTEGKRRFLLKKHAEITKMFCNEINELASDSIQEVNCVTYENYNFLTRMQIQGENLKLFHAPLTAQAARSEL